MNNHLEYKLADSFLQFQSPRLIRCNQCRYIVNSHIHNLCKNLCKIDSMYNKPVLFIMVCEMVDILRVNVHLIEFDWLVFIHIFKYVFNRLDCRF